MTSDRRAVRKLIIAFAALVAVALAAVVASVAGGHDVQEPTPRDTVRDFLITSVVNSDGVDACGYLTAHAMRELAKVEPRDTTCHQALSDTRLALGGERVDTQAQVKGLGWSVSEHGGRARVTVSADGSAATFLLRHATRAELAEGDAPPTPWRIDSGVDRVALR
jgi:FlaG/FlaF family flagellin (archaellin)